MDQPSLPTGTHTREHATPRRRRRLRRSLAHYLVVPALVLGVVCGLWLPGLLTGKGLSLNPFSTASQSDNSRIVEAISREQNVELLRLNIQGIASKNVDAKLFDTVIPGTQRALYLQYSYAVKLGVDGSKVTVSRSGDHHYRVNVPEFIVLGHSDVRLKKAVEDNGVISLVTPEIDVADMAQKILSEDGERHHIAENAEALRKQTETFYGGIIRAIDPQASVEVVPAHSPAS